MLSKMIGISVLVFQVLVISTLILYLLPSDKFKFADSLKTYLNTFLNRNYRIAGLVLSLTAVSGSLVFSEFMGLKACQLCWYQRILIFPMPLLYLVSIVLEKEKVQDYIMPMSLIGFFISMYNYYIQFTSATFGCSKGISCSKIQFETLGYVTIPMMALSYFLAMISMTLYSYNKS